MLSIVVVVVALEMMNWQLLLLLASHSLSVSVYVCACNGQLQVLNELFKLFFLFFAAKQQPCKESLSFSYLYIDFNEIWFKKRFLKSAKTEIYSIADWMLSAVCRLPSAVCLKFIKFIFELCIIYRAIFEGIRIYWSNCK